MHNLYKPTPTSAAHNIAEGMRRHIQEQHAKHRSMY